MDYAAIVLAGGAARRMGGVAKPLLSLGGESLLDRVLDVLQAVGPIVVVGPSEVDSGRPGVLRVQEDPPRGGPVAAIAAGLAALPKPAAPAVADPQGTASRAPGSAPASTRLPIVVVGADLPFISPAALSALRDSLLADVALFVDDTGRRQPMLSMWRDTALREALAEGPVLDRSMRSLLNNRDVAEVRWHGTGPPPWYDCDTPEALREAEKWL